jgi:hypothetical protein
VSNAVHCNATDALLLLPLLLLLFIVRIKKLDSFVYCSIPLALRPVHAAPCCY